MNYWKIRSEYQDHNYLNKVFIDPYAMLISPVFTKVFIKYNIIPNVVTILMIISGIVGALLFSFSNITLKVLGLIFIHIWYILDCSDGEVARITKRFSMFGKELDSAAHIINHPLFSLSFAISMLSLNQYDSIKIILLFLILASLDLIFRSFISLDTIYQLRNPSKILSNKNNKLRKVITYLLNIFLHYPNFAIIFPITYFIDTYYNTTISITYIIVVLSVCFLMTIRMVLKWILEIIYL